MLSCFYYWRCNTDLIYVTYIVLTKFLTYGRLQYHVGVIPQHILNIVKLIMIHNKDSQLVANVDYQLLKKDLDFMITKTLFIRCYSINCGLSLDEFQHNIMHDIVA